MIPAVGHRAPRSARRAIPPMADGAYWIACTALLGLWLMLSIPQGVALGWHSVAPSGRKNVSGSAGVGTKPLTEEGRGAFRAKKCRLVSGRWRHVELPTPPSMSSISTPRPYSLHQLHAPIHLRQFRISVCLSAPTARLHLPTPTPHSRTPAPTAHPNTSPGQRPGYLETINI